jgi:hypothetical protein
MQYRTFIGSVTLAMAVSLAASAGAQAPLSGYTPFSSRYRVVTSMQVSQVMQGQTMDSETSANQLTSLVLAKDGGALALTITVDSITASATGQAPAADPATAVGLKFSGTMNPDGHVVTSTVTDKAGNPSDSPFAANLRSFLPRLKAGATPGTTWADTTTTTRQQNGGTVTTVIATTYTLAGDTTVAGAKDWKLAAVSTGTVSGTGNQGGADYTIKGSINGTGTLVVGAGGALEGAELANNAQMMVDVPMAGLQIPVTQKQSTKITRVR